MMKGSDGHANQRSHRSDSVTSGGNCAVTRVVRHDVQSDSSARRPLDVRQAAFTDDTRWFQHEDASVIRVLCSLNRQLLHCPQRPKLNRCFRMPCLTRLADVP